MKKNIMPSTSSPGPREEAFASAPLDAEELYLLDWVKRGRPQEEIVYGEDDPPTTVEDWRDAEVISVSFTRK